MDIPREITRCGYCNIEDPTYAYEEGWKICTDCGYSVPHNYLVRGFQQPLGSERKKTEYRRDTYFRRFMDYIRGFHTDKYELTLEQEKKLFAILKEKNLYSISSYQLLYDILRIYKIRGLVKHIPYICHTYFGVSFPAISSQQCIMFEEEYNRLEKEFQKTYSEDGRTSFLSLGFLLNRFCEEHDIEITDNIAFFDIGTPQRKEEQMKLYDKLK